MLLDLTDSYSTVNQNLMYALLLLTRFGHIAASKRLTDAESAPDAAVLHLTREGLLESRLCYRGVYCQLALQINDESSWSLPSKSLKLLPMLGVPSLPSREYPFLLGLLPDSSAGRRGERGPAGRLSPVEGPLDTMAGELVDESDVSE